MDIDETKYDEFQLLKRHFRAVGRTWGKASKVSRRSYEVGSGQQVSALSWGAGEPEVVLLHGVGQNAHTWDSVAIGLDVPLIAIDLPGHGHSDWREDHDYRAWSNADAVAEVIAVAAPRASAVVGMSLGGQTTVRLAAAYPYLVRRAVIVDSTPCRTRGHSALTAEQRGATLLLDGPAVFSSFDEILRATAKVVPGRPIESLRPGVLHNSRQLEDGRWIWRYDMQRAQHGYEPSALSDDLSAIAVPIMLVCGEKSGRVSDADRAEFLRRQPGARIETVKDAGHSVQSDQPRVLASLISDFISTTP